MSSIDQQFIEYVVKALVSNPDAVLVERRIDEKGVLLELTVDPEDLGRVIGKRGATAQSLRTLLRALGTKNDARYNLKIVDNGVSAPVDGSTDGSNDSRPASHNDEDDGMTTPAVVPATAAADDGDNSQVHADDDFASVRSDRTSSVDADDNSRVSKTRRELQELDDLDV